MEAQGLLAASESLKSVEPQCLTKHMRRGPGQCHRDPSNTKEQSVSPEDIGFCIVSSRVSVPMRIPGPRGTEPGPQPRLVSRDGRPGPLCVTDSDETVVQSRRRAEGGRAFRGCCGCGGGGSPVAGGTVALAPENPRTEGGASPLGGRPCPGRAKKSPVGQAPASKEPAARG